MSGGSFDYLYRDAEELQRRVEEMSAWCKQNGHEERQAELENLAADLHDARELMRTIEWVASGDYSPEKLK